MSEAGQKRSLDGGSEPPPDLAARAHTADASSGSDDDLGPMPAPADAAGGSQTKRRKTLKFEALFMEQLPSADRYYKSLMHRDTVNFVTVTRYTNFVVTTSVDGHVKFWKKQDAGVEFVKHYRAHLSTIVGLSASADGAFFATISADGTAKVFDVINFDLINILELKYVPRACCWVHKRGRADTVLAIAEENSADIRLYDGQGSGSAPLATVRNIHKKPCHILVYNEKYDCVVSADAGGMIEYWTPTEPYKQPADTFELKSSTDLFEFKRSKSVPSTLTLSQDDSQFVTTSISDRQVRVFSFARGKLLRKYDESLAAAQEMQQAGSAVHQLDDMEFGRRLAVERELDASAQAGVCDARANATGAGTANAVFDESGHFILYGTMLGIKVVNTVSNRGSRLLGKDETLRFLNMSLFQGVTMQKQATSIALAASDNPMANAKVETYPTLFCSAYKRSRFYLFTRDEPEHDPASRLGGNERDVFNERPTREERAIAGTAPGAKAAAKPTVSAATVHTTVGDIPIQLFPELVPKTVENFVGLVKKKYYNGVIFHRVIKKFMLQTGDPLGDGTGGESIWGREFADEFRRELRHDRPYTLSMANAGPNTNGSQFFITTVPTPWLDDKHTVFGRATGGIDAIHQIEATPVDKNDKPLDEIQIFDITLQ